MLTFLLFLMVILLIYGGANYFVYRRVLRGLMISGPCLWAVKFGMLGLILAYPLGKALEAFTPASSIFIWIGSFWMGALTYGFFLSVIFELIRKLDHLFGILPNFLLVDKLMTSRMSLAFSVVVVIMLLTAGRVRAMFPVIREVPIEVSKTLGDRDEYHIALISDFHLGTLVGKQRLDRVVDMINETGADVCLIAGDLIDEKAGRLGWIAEPLQRIEAADGVFAVTGNHEFYSGVKAFAQLMEKSNVTLLVNDVASAGAIQLIGLDDVTGAAQYEEKPVPIADLMERVDTHLPVVLMHHTPTRIKEAKDAGVDLMLSGHSHGGQLWPGVFLSKWVFHVPQGLSLHGKMAFYLGNGVGTWGPPIRIGATPEVTHIILTSKPE